MNKDVGYLRTKVEVGMVLKTVIDVTIWETSRPDKSYNTRYIIIMESQKKKKKPSSMMRVG